VSKKLNIHWRGGGKKRDREEKGKKPERRERMSFPDKYIWRCIAGEIELWKGKKAKRGNARSPEKKKTRRSLR